MLKKLSELKPKESGRVKTVKGQSLLTQRLLAMGIIKGTQITVIKLAPLGDPVEIKVKGYHLSLRREEASKISVETD